LITGSLNLLEPSGPAKVCNGNVLPLPLLDLGQMGAEMLERNECVGYMGTFVEFWPFKIVGGEICGVTRSIKPIGVRF
jgi:hypothetical protein